MLQAYLKKMSSFLHRVLRERGSDVDMEQVKLVLTTPSGQGTFTASAIVTEPTGG